MRYVIRPRGAKWDDLQETPVLQGDTVHEADPVKTGLLDKDGNEIIRVMDQVGFVRFKDHG